MAGLFKHARGVLPPGARIGRFELIRRLAKGGMAELYLARSLGIHGFEKLVVLKLVLAHLAEDRQFVEMFLGEARLAATLDHPNIVHVTDIGEVGGEPFFVMEYVHGQDLRSVLRTCSKRKRKLPLPVALTTVAGAAAGLHYVHEKRDGEGRYLGLVHRDVSPSNVMLSYEGGVKLVDFGIAKATEIAQATRAGVLKGKVNYMAPEQCDGKAIDRRTDVFALGIMLYETTLGRRLFSGDNDYHIMSRIVRGVFAKPSELQPHYPAKLEEIVLRALSADPDDRYASAQEVLKAVEDFAHDERISLSTRVVSDFLRELFGEQPLPTMDDGDDASPTALHPDARSAVRAVQEIAANAAPESGPSEPTGVVPARHLEATGVVEAPSGSASSVQAGTNVTSVAAAGVPRLSTALIDKTKRLPMEMTQIAPAAAVETAVAPQSPRAQREGGSMDGLAGQHLETTERADAQPSRPITPVAPVDNSGPLMPPPSRSQWWIGLAVVAVAVVGLGLAFSSSDGSDPTEAAPSAVDTVPAATARDAQPSGSLPPSAAQPVRAPVPAVAVEPVVQAESPRPESEPVSDEPVEIIETGTSDAALPEDAPGEPPSAEPSSDPRDTKRRRPGRRRKRTSKKKSSTSDGSQSLDAMYPGGKR